MSAAVCPLSTRLPTCAASFVLPSAGAQVKTDRKRKRRGDVGGGNATGRHAVVTHIDHELGLSFAGAGIESS